MPYADHRYDLKDHNPPPHELGFLGGLGKRSGTVRSKAHVQRPTTNQILFKMRTANRILVSFSEDPIMANSLTRKQLEKSPRVARRKQDLGMKIAAIQIADNITKVDKGLGGSSSSDTEPRGAAQEKKAEQPRSRQKPRGFNLGAMKKISFVSAFKPTSTTQLVEEPQDFRSWALAEREKRFQAQEKISHLAIRQEREANEIFPRIKRAPKVFLGGKKPKKAANQLPGSEHLGGYLYGGFTKDAGPDATMDAQTKFNVPLSMFSRAHVESKVRSMVRKKIQSARLDYMKIPQIPSDSENSDDIFEDIKGLSLIRTPYFSIPTITHTKVKRMERLKSKHLTGNRLKRINMLLFDRKATSEQKLVRREEELDEEAAPPETAKLPSVEKRAKQHSSPYRQRYHDFLHERFEEKLELYSEKLISFEEFREADTLSPMKDRKSFRDYSIETMSSSMVPTSATPDIQKDPAFKKVKRTIRRNVKSSRTDTRTSGFYFDPFLLEKVHNPEKGMKITKNYTSLMRSQSNIRRRLQVNAPTFDEERCGGFYHRLVTEWDAHYIDEIRHRPKVAKFCVKSDAIKIREMVRKKFFLFFMQEDLMNLFAKQEIENEMINKTTKFIKVRCWVESGDEDGSGSAIKTSPRLTYFPISLFVHMYRPASRSSSSCRTKRSTRRSRSSRR